LKIKIGYKMTKILLALVMALSFIGCTSKGEDLSNVTPKLTVGNTLTLNLNDQFEKSQTLNANTNKIIFAFAKDSAHICNDFFDTKEPTYLADNNSQFVADVSAAPSLIRSMFILPGLKDFKHTVLLLDNKAIAAPYRKGMDTEKIVLVSISNGKILAITTLNSQKELQEAIEAK
jgi:hypothetical protein